MKVVFYIMKKRKSFLITGATSGVGYALTKRLVKAGHEVWATGRAPDVLWELQNEGAHAIPADLSEKEGIDCVMNQIGLPDVVIFSAGVGTFQYAHELSGETTRKTMDINVVAPIELTKRLLPDMMARKSGHLIYLGSQAGKVATPKASVYAASKHALLGYANALRMEVAPFGIHVTTINPGPIDTPFLDLADKTGNYRTSLKKHLLSVDTVVDAIILTIEKPVREVNLPWYMGITSKLHALVPTLVERLGRNYFLKK
jgi:short-subunit dehydrogenase